MSKRGRRRGGLLFRMAAAEFLSFRGTGILFVSVRVAYGLPLLADERIEPILRSAWLEAMMVHRWFVGSYWIEPQRLSLLVTPDLVASPLERWRAKWKADSQARINAATSGRGCLWEDEDCPPLKIASEDEYYRQIAGMAELQAGATPPSAGTRCGMIWQLHPGNPPPGLERARLQPGRKMGTGPVWASRHPRN